MFPGSGIETTVWTLLPTLGVPILLVLFYLDGMIVGKMLPPGALYVGFAALVSPSLGTLAWLCLLFATASTLGQWTLYRGLNEDRPEFFGLRRRIPYIRTVPDRVRRRVGENRMKVVSQLFTRFGGPGLVISNTVPGVRSLLVIPAGLSRYPVGRFLVFSLLGNLLYLVVLSAVALGLSGLIGLVPLP